MTDYKFNYNGVNHQQVCNIHSGTLTDIHLEKEDKDAPHYLHVFPHYEFEAYSKKDLWKQVKTHCQGEIVEIDGKIVQC